MGLWYPQGLKGLQIIDVSFVINGKYTRIKHIKILNKQEW